MQCSDNFDKMLEAVFQQFNIEKNPESDKETKEKDELKSECLRFTKIAKKYFLICKDRYSEYLSKVVRKELSSGGELLPRGYYNPSPIVDIVVGNTGGKGKLLKRITSKSKPAYEYCFDKDDKLILVNYLHSNCAELLEYTGDTVTGITFSNNENYEITQIIECKYDKSGRIISTLIARSSFNDCNINEIEKETYAYDENGLNIAEYFHYFNGILNYDRFRFHHDKEGYLTEYQSDNSAIENNTYKIAVKRKI